MEETGRQTKHTAGVLGVVTNTFIAQEGVSAVDLMPVEAGSNFVETRKHSHAAFRGDVRILASPDHEELALDFSGAGHDP